jgi:hypothetical protein
VKSRLSKDYAPANEYYTPAWIFEGMGLRFDLDVCSPKDHVTAVPADRKYTIDDDGLVSDWAGTGVDESSIFSSDSMDRQIH